jgi:hypothetical protein
VVKKEDNSSRDINQTESLDLETRLNSVILDTCSFFNLFSIYFDATFFKSGKVASKIYGKRGKNVFATAFFEKAVRI